MRRSFALFFLLALSSLPCAAAISGTVTDRAGNGLSDVSVSLALAGTNTTTDANGTWSLAPAGIDARTVTTSRTRWTGKAVELTLAEPATVSVAAYDLKGAQQGRLARMKLGAGSHRLPLALSAPGMVWLRVTVNGRSEMVLGGMGGASVVSAIHESPLPNPAAARSLGIADTLLFTWKAMVVARVALANLDTSGIVVKIGTDSSIAWNESIAYGSVYDARDGQAYRTVKIGDQVWMAENLNYKVNNSWWYKGLDVSRPKLSGGYESIDENITRGARFGRLYLWAAVMGLPDSCNDSSCRSLILAKPKGICPSGWHVPSDAEWMTMQKVVDDLSTTDGAKLKSTSGWSDTGSGMDTYGFRALPAGYRYSGVSFQDVGLQCDWWSATEHDARYAGGPYIYYAFQKVIAGDNYKKYGFSLRCLSN